jgi:alpha-tubulin suppressor-like RCC1 family protein
VRSVKTSRVVRSVVISLGAFLVVLGTLVTASAATAASATGTASPASAPTIKSFKVSPSPISANGGKVTVTAQVRLAKTCTLSITPGVAGFPVTRQCASGSITVTLKVPPNDSVSTRHYTIKLSVKGSSRTVSATGKLAQPPRTLSGVKNVVGEGDGYCALLVSGEVDCWGFNAYGQLGDGNTKNSSRPAAVKGVGGKGLLTGVTSVVSGAFGYGDSYCAVLHAGGVDCWGLNQDGQLGNGATTTSDKPVAVKGVGGTGLLAGATQVQPELYGFCAALTSGGAACWGLNDDGELGSGSALGPDSCGALETPCGTTPVHVVGTGGTGTLGHVAHLAGEGSSMCALLTTGGADCWGYGPNGQLGNGTMSDSPVPAAVKGHGGTGSLAGVTSLTGDNDNGTNVCARLTTGRTDCWGDDTWGELGDGETGLFNDSAVPVAVKGVAGKATLLGVASLVGVPGLTNCAILTSGDAVCWGYNGDNQLGDGGPSSFDSDVPVRVAGTSGKGSLGGITSLVTSTGDSGESICAVLTSGGVDCWGYAPSGYSAVPKAVPGFGATRPLTRVRSLASDQDGSNCAVLVTGGVDCWGADFVGQLGNGTTTGSPAPEAVLAPAE